jgi:hypothetical protein
MNSISCHLIKRHGGIVSRTGQHRIGMIERELTQLLDFVPAFRRHLLDDRHRKGRGAGRPSGRRLPLGRTACGNKGFVEKLFRRLG